MNIVAVIDAYREDESFEGEVFTFASGSAPEDVMVTTPEGKVFILDANDLNRALSALRMAAFSDDY